MESTVSIFNATMSGVGLYKNPVLKICFYFVKNDIHLLFDLAQIAVTLDFTYNAMSEER